MTSLKCTPGHRGHNPSFSTVLRAWRLILGSDGVNPSSVGFQDWPDWDSGKHDQPEVYPGPTGVTTLAFPRYYGPGG